MYILLNIIIEHSEYVGIWTLIIIYIIRHAQFAFCTYVKVKEVINYNPNHVEGLNNHFGVFECVLVYFCCLNKDNMKF